jgi:hypothetical protein
MATLNASKWGFVTSGNQSTHAAARGATTGTVAVNPTSTATAPIEYTRLAGRGRGSFIYRVTRTFYYFDTSGITNAVSAASINILGSTQTNADVIVIPSTAFSGDGSTNLVGTDIDNVTFNTNYSDEYSSWASSNNSITLKSQARTDIQNNNYFICATIQYDNDYLNTDPGSNGQRNSSINFGTTAYLDYTESTPSGPTNVASFAGIAKASISKLSAVTFGDITNINGVS